MVLQKLANNNNCRKLLVSSFQMETNDVDNQEKLLSTYRTEL